MNVLHNARVYATKAHNGQTYGGEFPYVIHLQAVESVLLRFGITDENLRCAAWLHDVLEDTDLTYEDLVMFFGSEVANIVAALTEPKGGNRKWRHSQTYPRIRQNNDAIIVKLADRIANVEAGGRKLGMYRKEHHDFKHALYNVDELRETRYHDVVREMWNYLDSLLIVAPDE